MVVQDDTSYDADPYISAHTDSAAIISGPLTILDQLHQSKKLPEASSIKLRVNGSYHAPHLHDSGDMGQDPRGQ
jgi:hypothetical protein